MRKSRFFTAGLGIGLGSLLLLAAFITLPTGSADGAGLLATPGASATVDPGQATPNDPDPRPTQTATRPPTTPTVVPTPTPRAGTLTITPNSGSIGTEIAIAGSGFSPNALLVLIVEDAAGATMSYSQPGVDGAGAFTSRLATVDYAAGEYAVTVASLPNITTLAQSKFTLSGMPGLPNTGEGAVAARDSRATWLGGAVALLALLVGGGLYRRRRGA